MGVINVQHGDAHFHSGDEMELLTTIGEQIGSLVALSLMNSSQMTTSAALDLVMAPARQV